MSNQLFSLLEQKHGLPSGLLDAVWATESGRGRNMLSPAGARGHFQFMPATAQQYGLQNPDDLEESAQAAARMYGDLLKKYSGDLPKALAAYNWGQGNVDRKGMDKAPAETRGYIQKITAKVQPMQNDFAGQIKQAKESGYSDAEILQFLSSSPKHSAKFKQARDAGYSDAEIAQHFGLNVAAQAQPTQPEKAPDPTGSFLDNARAGAGKFMVDTARGVKGLWDDAAAALESVIPGAQTVNTALGTKSAAQVQQEGREAVAESRRLDAPLMNTAGGKVGFVGGALATAPLLPATSTLRGAAAVGAGLGATQPAVNFQERLTNTAIGGAAGAAGQAVVNGVARVVRPNTSQEVKTLLDNGVTPTPGQIIGGAAKRTEDALTSVPLVGDAIKTGQRRAVAELNEAAFNRALAPVGEKLPKGMVGREAVEYVGEALGARYNNLLPKLTTKADGQFVQEIGNLRNMVKQGAIDPNSARYFERVLKNDVLGKFKGQNAVTGQTLKQIESDLGQQIARLSASTDADQRLAGEALQEVQSALRNLVQRTNPQYAEQLKAINAGWANFKRVQRAASGVGAEGGVFSAAQLQSAVKAMDRSKDKAAFARGGALMQDLSEPAKSVLGSSVPDSGTPLRLFAAGGAGAGLTGLLSPSALAGAAAAPVMYSRAGQNALATVLARRPDAANRLAQLIRNTGNLAPVGSAAYAVQQ